MSITFTSNISMDELRRYFHGTGVSDLDYVKTAVYGSYVGYYFGDDPYTILSGTYQDEKTHDNWFVFVLRHNDKKRFERDILVAPLGQQHEAVYVRRNVTIRNTATQEDQRTDIYIVNAGLNYARFGVVRWGRNSYMEFFTTEREISINSDVYVGFLDDDLVLGENHGFCGGRIWSRELSSKYWGEVLPTS